MNLQELRELQGEEVLTNQSVIGMIENALTNIDEELHSQPNIVPKTPGTLSSRHGTTSVSNEQPVSPTNETAPRPPDAIETSKLAILRQIADGHPLPELMEELNRKNNRPFTQERAEHLFHNIFTKLYGRVTRGEADEEEVRTWHDINGRVPALGVKEIRDDFRDYMSKYFHGGNNQIPRPERRTREPHEKKPIDPHELIKSVLNRIEKHGIKIGSAQHFIPRAAFEIFGITQSSMRDSLEKGYVNPKKGREMITIRPFLLKKQYNWQ
jgi:hypothetical protein